MSDSDYSDTESEFDDFIDYDEDNEDEDEELYIEDDAEDHTSRMAGERFVEKCQVYEGCSADRLSMSEIVHLVSVGAQTIENGRPHKCDVSLIPYAEISTIDLAIAEISQGLAPYQILREYNIGNNKFFELIDPNLCTFNKQDIKEQYLHNTEKTFDN